MYIMLTRLMNIVVSNLFEVVQWSRNQFWIGGPRCIGRGEPKHVCVHVIFILCNTLWAQIGTASNLRYDHHQHDIYNNMEPDYWGARPTLLDYWGGQWPPGAPVPTPLLYEYVRSHWHQEICVLLISASFEHTYLLTNYK